MLKNNKFLITFLIILFLFILLSVPVYASEGDTDNYIFTGADGVTYNLPSLPSCSQDYSHFVLIKVPDGDATNYILLFFNDSLGISKSEPNENSITIIIDSISESRLFQSLNGGAWEDLGVMNSNTIIPIDCVFINACDDVFQYLDEMNSEDSFFYNPPTVENQDILVPIIQKTPLEGVLKEIMEVLPVVLVVIVALIAVRKAIAFLKKTLNQS